MLHAYLSFVISFTHSSNAQSLVDLFISFTLHRKKFIYPLAPRMYFIQCPSNDTPHTSAVRQTPLVLYCRSSSPAPPPSTLSPTCSSSLVQIGLHIQRATFRLSPASLLLLSCLSPTSLQLQLLFEQAATAA